MSKTNIYGSDNHDHQGVLCNVSKFAYNRHCAVVLTTNGEAVPCKVENGKFVVRGDSISDTMFVTASENHCIVVTITNTYIVQDSSMKFKTLQHNLLPSFAQGSMFSISSHYNSRFWFLLIEDGPVVAVNDKTCECEELPNTASCVVEGSVLYTLTYNGSCNVYDLKSKDTLAHLTPTTSIPRAVGLRQLSTCGVVGEFVPRVLSDNPNPKNMFHKLAPVRPELGENVVERRYVTLYNQDGVMGEKELCIEAVRFGEGHGMLIDGKDVVISTVRHVV